MKSPIDTHEPWINLIKTITSNRLEWLEFCWNIAKLRVACLYLPHPAVFRALLNWTYEWIWLNNCVLGGLGWLVIHCELLTFYSVSVLRAPNKLIIGKQITSTFFNLTSLLAQFLCPPLWASFLLYLLTPKGGCYSTSDNLIVLLFLEFSPFMGPDERRRVLHIWSQWWFWISTFGVEI